MLVSYNWLKTLVAIEDIKPEDLAEEITKAGIEVDAVHDLGAGMQKVVVGYVQSCQKHPDADKLSVCQVDIGEEEDHQIVCGAKNIAAGQKVIVAKHGAVLPGNVKIKKSKLRGEVSNGMICSLKEMGIDDKFVPQAFREGIYVFTDDVTVGDSVLPYLNLTDHVLELDLTPNRADALNMLGMAYETAAIYDRELSLPQPDVVETSEQAADYIDVQIDDKTYNPYYGARIIKNVTVDDSPRWLQTRLIAAGIRPINNIVDITNYVLIEYGQPLHAFDYDRFASKHVVTRRAGDDETMETLDGEVRELSDDYLMITNGEQPLAIAGVMGGASSEVQNDTKHILLEAAYFDSGHVRQTATALDLHSDASHRYERGVDPQRIVPAANRAAQLMHDVAGGDVLQGIVEAGDTGVRPEVISLSAGKVNRVLGTDIAIDQMAHLLERLGFTVDVAEDMLTVTVPTRRMDVKIPEDVIEEIGRIYGYDQLPTTLPYGDTTPGLLTDFQKKRRAIRHYLEGAGLYEAVTYSLLTEEAAQQYRQVDDMYHPVTLPRPMSQDHSTLRMSLTMPLLQSVRHNLNHNIENIALYEFGPVFYSDEAVLTKQPYEQEKLAAVFSGVWESHPWKQEKTAVDFFTVKGVLDGIFRRLGLLGRVKYNQTAKDGLHPGRTATVTLDKRPIGFIGQIHPSKAQALDIRETYVFEIDADMLFSAYTPALAYRPLPKYPAITRDIALVVDEEVSAANIEAVIREAGAPLLDQVHIFDVYQGEHLQPGQKSIAYALTYYDEERTLTDDEVTDVHQRILQQVEDVFGATLRR